MGVEIIIMKSFQIALPVLFTFFAAFGIQAHADTANEILADPAAHHEKSVRLDVVFLRPVRWTSPVPEVAFFHAITFDKRNQNYGGEILLAAPESARDSLIRRYGVTGDRRKPTTTSLRAVLRNTGSETKRGLWYIDQTEGTLTEAIAEKHAQIEAAAGKGQFAGGLKGGR
jgi:hypothetical protein